MKPFFDYQLYIFDLDNTLYNENDYLFGAYNAIGQALGNKEYADFLITSFKKNGRKDLFNEMVKHFSLPDSAIDTCLETLRTYQPSVKMKLREGVLPLLDKLKREGKQLALLTNGNVQQQKNKVKNIGPALSTYFPLIVYANDHAPKPSPVGVELILKQTGIKKENCLMIGDVPDDELTAKNAGVDFIYDNQLPKTLT